MNAVLPRKVALRCLARTAAVNAAVTTRGMQQLGLMYVLAPGLRHLYPDPERRRRAFARYAEHSNTHAFMLPAYAGLLLNLEGQTAAGALPEAAMASLRQTLATTLSAIGDGFFSGAVRTTWALVTICLVLNGYVAAAAALTGFLLLLLTVFRVTGFFLCLRHGIASLQWLRRLDIVSWTGRIKIFNAVLVAVTLCVMLEDEMGDWPGTAQAGIFVFIPVASFLVGRLHVPRTVLWIFVLGVVVLVEGGYIAF